MDNDMTEFLGDALLEESLTTMISNRERAIWEGDHDNEREPQDNDDELEARGLLEQNGD